MIQIPPIEEQTEDTLSSLFKQIRPLDTEAMKKAEERQAYLAKVPGTLGRLEDISIRLAGISGKITGNTTDRQVILLMCADNGVVEEGVASAPQTVTLMQTINFSKRITGVSAQAAYFGIDILDIDVGVRLPVPPELLTKDMLEKDGTLTSKIIDRNIRHSTSNLAKEPAMSRKEAVRALFIGLEAVEAAVRAGKNIIGVGEMGIGNSTTAACIIHWLTGMAADTVVGRGGGLNDKGLNKKVRVVEEAVKRYQNDDVLETARSLGGFDLFAMAGAFLGAAIYRIPAVIDGYISIASALLAQALVPSVTDFLFTSHRSKEPGYRAALGKIGIEPMFNLGMKLGEGSGCPIAFKIMEAATAVMNGMKTLAEGGIDAGYLDELREKNLF